MDGILGKGRKSGANCAAIHVADVERVQADLLPDDDYVSVASVGVRPLITIG